MSLTKYPPDYKRSYVEHSFGRVRSGSFFVRALVGSTNSYEVLNRHKPTERTSRKPYSESRLILAELPSLPDGLAFRADLSPGTAPNAIDL